MKVGILHVALALVMVFSMLGAVLALPTQTKAVDRHVGPGQTYSTIQDAIDSSIDGDVIIVHDGTYTEQISTEYFEGALTIRSENGAGSTIIDAVGTTGPAVYLVANDDDDAVVFGGENTGFTVINANHRGVYAIANHEGAVTIEDNIIHGGGWSGVAIYSMNEASVTVENNTIYGNGYQEVNILQVSGAATLTIENNEIRDNTLEGIYAETIRDLGET